MASSFFSDNEKRSLASELDGIAKTWEHPILISLEAEKTIILTNDNFNRFQANELNLIEQNPVNSPNIYTGMARILYEKRQPVNYITPYVGGNRDDTQLKIENQDGKVRIKINPSGGQFLQKSKLIQLDGISFKLDSVQRPHGLFDVDYWTFYLKREM